MISRKNFITVTILMAILFFLFQFTGVAKETLNQYEVNEYETGAQTALTETDAFLVKENGNMEIAKGDRGYAVFIGRAEEKGIGEAVRWWCSYSKRNLASYDSLKDVNLPPEHLPEVMVLDSACLDFPADTGTLKGYADQGIHLVFATLPDPEMIGEDRELSGLLGIRYVRKTRTRLKGMHLFEGFLLGGERIYELTGNEDETHQDLMLDIPWYVLGAGTKGYLMGTMEDERILDEELPAVIWRSSAGNAKVFAVNGDYLSDASGIGILEAMMSETESCWLHPVVNAQSLVLANFPGLASENAEEIKRRYSQDQRGLFREIIWPALLSAAMKNGDRLTCLLAPQYDYADEKEPAGTDLSYYLKLLKEQYGEAGLSTDFVSETTLRDKLKADCTFLNETAPDYAIRSCYLGNEERLPELLLSAGLPKLRTVAAGKKEDEAGVISYAGRDVTLQRATSSGIRHTFRDDLRVRSLETALGYSNIVLDLMPAAYPEHEEDSWEKMAKQITGNLGTYWKNYSAFQKTTLSQSDQKIRRFLALDYAKERTGNTISLTISGFEEEAWFLLRLKGEELFTCEGASFTEVEQGVYLIGAVSEHVTMELKPDTEILFYEE